MAVTSIWSIKGWIGKVINYAENPDKTKENNEGQIVENQSLDPHATPFNIHSYASYAVRREISAVSSSAFFCR